MIIVKELFTAPFTTDPIIHIFLFFLLDVFHNVIFMSINKKIRTGLIMIC